MKNIIPKYGGFKTSNKKYSIMKKIFIIPAFIFSFLIISCNKKLDVKPQNSITPAEIKTEDDVKAVLFGGYKLLQNGGAFGEQFISIADLLASKEQVDFYGTFTDLKNIQDKTQTSQNYVPQEIWLNSYQIINSMNTVLDKINLVSDDERSAISAEAKCIRGITNFMMINFFALPYSASNTTTNPGIPLMFNAVYDSTILSSPPRNTVEEVYTQVMADLNDAKDNLPENFESDNDKARTTKYTAEAFLARVYLNMAKYEEAATMANDVIESGYYSLTGNYADEFNQSSLTTEDVFAILQSAQSNAGTGSNGLTTFYTSYPEGRGDIQINKKYYKYFDDGDARKSFNYSGYGLAGFDGDYTNKWKLFYKTIPVIRLAEMYLTRGEANLRKGGSPVGGVQPDDDINIVRQRSDAAAITDATANDFMDERFRELGFEGDRLWTLKRLQLDVDGYAYTYDKLVLPVPQREIDVNKNLEQNPGY